MSGTSREQEIVNILKEKFSDKIIEARVQRERRVFVTIDPKALLEVMKYLAHEKGYKHISTISGLDLGKNLGVIYHLLEDNITLSLKIEIPKENPRISTITSIIPGAVLYEREVHDLFGVVFRGHPDLSPLVLPEDWPKGLYPLRKEYKIEDIKAKINRTKK